MMIHAVRSLIRGVAAGSAGTLAMDTLLYRRYHHSGGQSGFLAWESSEGVESWEHAPAPALVGKRLLESMVKRQVSPRYARLLNNATHWGFGLAAGAAYGLAVSFREPRVWSGLPFGAAVWATGYVVLPRLGVYEEIWNYDLKTLEKDLSAHLAFGMATAAALRLLTNPEDANQCRNRHSHQPRR
jgi:hypothetical protein